MNSQQRDGQLPQGSSVSALPNAVCSRNVKKRQVCETSNMNQFIVVLYKCSSEKNTWALLYLSLQKKSNVHIVWRYFRPLLSPIAVVCCCCLLFVVVICLTVAYIFNVLYCCALPVQGWVSKRKSQWVCWRRYYLKWVYYYRDNRFIALGTLLLLWLCWLQVLSAPQFVSWKKSAGAGVFDTWTCCSLGQRYCVYCTLF